MEKTLSLVEILELGIFSISLLKSKIEELIILPLGVLSTLEMVLETLKYNSEDLQILKQSLLLIIPQMDLLIT